MPTLVIHSEEDWRCPVEQGARLFVALKRRGVPTELLLFPGEGHELSRSGPAEAPAGPAGARAAAGGPAGCRPLENRPEAGRGRARR